jgi:hypothetical protein
MKILEKISQKFRTKLAFDDLNPETYQFPERDPWEDSSTNDEELEELENLYRALVSQKARKKKSNFKNKFVKQAEEIEDEFSESARQEKLRQLMEEYRGLHSSVYQEDDGFGDLLSDFSSRVKENPSEDELDDFEDEDFDL